MHKCVFTLTLQTNETQRWISFYLDLSKPAVPFVLGSQIHKQLTNEEVSIGPMIAWSICRKIGHGLFFFFFLWVFECMYRAVRVKEMRYSRITREPKVRLLLLGGTNGSAVFFYIYFSLLIFLWLKYQGPCLCIHFQRSMDIFEVPWTFSSIASKRNWSHGHKPALHRLLINEFKLDIFINIS